MHLLELLAIFLFCFDCWVQRLYHGPSYWRAVDNKWVWLKLSSLGLIFLNMLLLWSGAVNLSLARALRPLLLLERLRNVRRIITNIVQVRSCSVGALLA